MPVVPAHAHLTLLAAMAALASGCIAPASLAPEWDLPTPDGLPGSPAVHEEGVRSLHWNGTLSGFALDKAHIMGNRFVGQASAPVWFTVQPGTEAVELRMTWEAAAPSPLTLHVKSAWAEWEIGAGVEPTNGTAGATLVLETPRPGEYRVRGWADDYAVQANYTVSIRFR